MHSGVARRDSARVRQVRSRSGSGTEAASRVTANIAEMRLQRSVRPSAEARRVRRSSNRRSRRRLSLPARSGSPSKQREAALRHWATRSAASASMQLSVFVCIQIGF